MQRRRFLRGAAAVGAGLAAGCVQIQDPDGGLLGDGASSPTPPEDPQFPESVRADARDVGERARESVVVAEADRPGPTATTGAAWVVEPSTLATTAHGVTSVESVTAWTVDGDSLDAAVLGRTGGDALRGDDVAVLGIDGEMTTLRSGDSDSLSEGQPLVQVGHPFAVGNWVVAVGRFVGTGSSGRLLSTLPAMQGNSGSPVLTLDGEVVGMTVGSVPRERDPRFEGEAPDPAPTHVYEEYDDATYALHHAVETVAEYVREWG